MPYAIVSTSSGIPINTYLDAEGWLMYSYDPYMFRQFKNRDEASALMLKLGRKYGGGKFRIMKV